MKKSMLKCMDSFLNICPFIKNIPNDLEERIDKQLLDFVPIIGGVNYFYGRWYNNKTISRKQERYSMGLMIYQTVVTLHIGEIIYQLLK